ncbi:MAG: GNAT family N-acetyltransferase [Isosphaeraceae bacterium]|nr:GNAT family N-acetyltransferase [Isosphaeraceae bacterium]
MIQIRPMTGADIALGLRLAQSAGWNQVEADWQRLLALQPDGCFVAEVGSMPVGTTATCVFGAVAWVAMVLVDEPYRGRGIGRALMTQALAYLDNLGVPTVRLDATALGRLLYEKLGFVEEARVLRFRGCPRPIAIETAEPVEAARPEHLDALIALDRSVTGTDRSQLLHRLYQEDPQAVRVVERGGRVEGFLMTRPGRQAIQVGPCIASRAVGPALLADAWRRLAGQPVYIDLLTDHAEARALAAAAGLTSQRQLVRMRRGAALAEHPEELWASSGPEKG